jgi:hypothetical protein
MAISAQRETYAPQNLRTAFNEAMQFAHTRANTLALPEDQISHQARAETASGRIAVDEYGLSPGIHLSILQRARDFLGEWDNAKAAFMSEIMPSMKDIQALDKLDGDVSDLKHRRRHVRDQLEAKWDADRDFKVAKRDAEEAEQLWFALRDSQDQRKANLASYHPLYWFGIMSIGAAEWLINYDTLFLFFGVPAIAVGSTLILGIALGFAAHGHGKLIKQWGASFGQQVNRHDRFSNYRLFWLAAFSLIIVLAAAGGSRYAAAMHVMRGQPSINIIGQVIEVNPIRDVLISLLANIAAWVVGVFFAWFCHDKDPRYAEVYRAYLKAERSWLIPLSQVTLHVVR